MKDTQAGKAALKKIDTIKMFSEEGWKKVNRICGKVSKDGTDEELADGFQDFQEIWYEDNGVEAFDFANEEAVNDKLIERWSDYLLGD